MRCTVDGTTLVIPKRRCVEFDYRPYRRGVWLDPGTTDKTIERRPQNMSVSPRPGGRAHPPYRNRTRGGFSDELVEF